MSKTAGAAQRAKLSRLSSLIEAGDWPEARPLAAKLLARAPNDPPALYLAARLALAGANDPEAAERLLTRALQVRPGYAPALSLMYSVRFTLGCKTGAAEIAERLIADMPDQPLPYLNLITAAPERGEAMRERMERLAASPRIDERGRAALFVGLGLIHERRGRLDAAMTAFRAGKSFGAPPYESRQVAGLLTASQARFARRRAQPTAPLGDEDDRMVFVLGLPRSGSSLIERILSAHSNAASAGETFELTRCLREAFQPAPVGARPSFAELDGVCGADPDRLRAVARLYLSRLEPFLRRPQARRWIDKMPGNFLYCGAIATLFPNARIIMTHRDPRDVMLSCLRVHFAAGQGFAQNDQTFTHYYAAQQEFSDLWRETLGDRFLEVAYEDLVQSPEQTARRMVEHVGLPWEDACARPEQNAGSVNTASGLQVREAVHTRSIGGWRRYETQFAPLTAMLERYWEARDRRAVSAA